MTKAKINQRNQTNKYKKKISYNFGEKIWLFTKNISVDQLSKKLDHKIIGLFKVIEKKSILLELQLPQSMKIYNVFRLNLLEKALTDPLKGQINESAPPIIIIYKDK